MSLAFGLALPHWYAISGGAFSPASLFAGGTVAGAWYDPSDPGTLFTTSAGTTQCAMPGQGSAVPVGRMLDKSGNGNHAISFNDTTARPELRARVNLLTYSEEFDNGAWTKADATITSNAVIAPNGTLTADAIIPTVGFSQHFISQTFAAGSYTYTIYAKAFGYSFLTLAAFDGVTSPAGWPLRAIFDLSNGVVALNNGGGAASIQSVGNGWYRCSVTGTSAASAAFRVQVTNTTADANASFTGDGTSGIYIWGADLRPANIGANVPAYQRIADANTYDTSGFPLYLFFDGIDDSMYTPANLNLSGTDKVAVFAGVRKLSDAVDGLLCELSTNVGGAAGSFYIATPESAALLSYAFLSRGTASASSSQRASTPLSTYPAPITNVLAATGDIAGDLSTIRVNGVAGTNATGDQGAGNYGNYPLFIGSRANTSVFFNGWLTSLIVRGAQSTQGQIEATESWVNAKTGAF
jgi:hypothetical protein